MLKNRLFPQTRFAPFLMLVAICGTAESLADTDRYDTGADSERRLDEPTESLLMRFLALRATVIPYD